uniref:Putative secreted protein n=1 Tax=Ixodes ricinus TaxID=34613 RepID=A0A6B0UI35_IXORI
MVIKSFLVLFFFIRKRLTRGFGARTMRQAVRNLLWGYFVLCFFRYLKLQSHIEHTKETEFVADTTSCLSADTPQRGLAERSLCVVLAVRPLLTLKIF